MRTIIKPDTAIPHSSRYACRQAGTASRQAGTAAVTPCEYILNSLTALESQVINAAAGDSENRANG